MIATPSRVEYVEVIAINVDRSEVYNSIRRQVDLMKWSAWPSETGSSCSVKGDDGKVGAQTIFLDKKGRKFGYQEVTELVENVQVSFKLESKGPPHVPALHFYLSELRPETTHVTLHFTNDITPPFHLPLRLFGVVKWTRQMHVKDLDGLKRFLERSEDYQGHPL
jgi:hypothetical protein